MVRKGPVTVRKGQVGVRKGTMMVREGPENCSSFRNSEHTYSPVE